MMTSSSPLGSVSSFAQQIHGVWAQRNDLPVFLFEFSTGPAPRKTIAGPEDPQRRGGHEDHSLPSQGDREQTKRRATRLGVSEVKAET